MIAGPGTLIGELALLVAMPRPATATALEYSLAIRIARTLFLRVLESDPAAARRLRDEFANRTRQIASDMLMASAKLRRSFHAFSGRETVGFAWKRQWPTLSMASHLDHHRDRHMIGRPLPASGVAGDPEVPDAISERP